MPIRERRRRLHFPSHNILHHFPLPKQQDPTPHLENGQHPLSPATNLRVIGAGMSRTGTASFSAALSILRDGPVYHGGEALFLREEAHLKNWIRILRYTPCRSPADERIVTAGVRERRLTLWVS